MVFRRGRFNIIVEASVLYLSVCLLGASTGCSQKYAIGVGALSASNGSGNGGANVAPPAAPPGNDVPEDDPNASRPSQVETFSAFQSSPISQEQSPKVRILMVIDNSKSTEPYQATFSAGFQNFANQYFTSGLDLSVATITTDTYLAGTVSSGAGYGPNSGQCLSRLVPGVHDGPIPGIADGLSSPFTTGTCNLTSSAASRIRSNGDRSLRPIISTVPSDGSTPNASYISQLISDFEKNAKPGVSGNGSERGFQSVYQFLKDNESRSACSQNPVTDPSCFFPHYNLATGTVRPINAIVFVSDEHDQSNSNFGMGGAAIQHDNSAISSMNDSTLMSSSVTLARAFKASLDKFFLSLHESGNTDPNYSVFGITNITCKSSCGISHGSRNGNEAWGIEYDALIDAYTGNNGSNGRPVQAADTVNSQAGNSKLYDINSTGYDSLFDYIGTQIVNSTHLTMVYNYTLAQVPMANTVSAVLILANGHRTAVPADLITVSGNVVSLSANITSLVPSPDSQVRVEVSYK